MYYTPYFPIYLQLQQPCASENQVSLPPSCTRLNVVLAATLLHFFNNLVMALKSFPTDDIFRGSKKVEI